MAFHRYDNVDWEFNAQLMRESIRCFLVDLEYENNCANISDVLGSFSSLTTFLLCQDLLYQRQV